MNRRLGGTLAAAGMLAGCASPKPEVPITVLTPPPAPETVVHADDLPADVPPAVLRQMANVVSVSFEMPVPDSGNDSGANGNTANGNGGNSSVGTGSSSNTVHHKDPTMVRIGPNIFYGDGGMVKNGDNSMNYDTQTCGRLTIDTPTAQPTGERQDANGIVTSLHGARLIVNQAYGENNADAGSAVPSVSEMSVLNSDVLPDYSANPTVISTNGAAAVGESLYVATFGAGPDGVRHDPYEPALSTQAIKNGDSKPTVIGAKVYDREVNGDLDVAVTKPYGANSIPNIDTGSPFYDKDGRLLGITREVKDAVTADSFEAYTNHKAKMVGAAATNGARVDIVIVQPITTDVVNLLRKDFDNAATVLCN